MAVLNASSTLEQIHAEYADTASYAEDGDVAIARLDKSEFDVVLLDIRMPNVGGIDVLKHIRDKGMKLRVIMLTAVDDLTIAMESVRLGASDYLTKPFDTEDLFSAIRRISAS